MTTSLPKPPPELDPDLFAELGAKFMGASADVADRIAKRLASDYRRAKIAAEAGAGPGNPKP